VDKKSKRSQLSLKSCYFHSSPKKPVISNSSPQLVGSSVVNQLERRSLSQKRSQQLLSLVPTSPQHPCLVALKISQPRRCLVETKQQTRSVEIANQLPVCSAPLSQLGHYSELLQQQEVCSEQVPLPVSSRAQPYSVAPTPRRPMTRMIQVTKKKIKVRRAHRPMQIPTKSSSSKHSVKLFRRTPTQRRSTRKSTNLRSSSHCHPLPRTRKVNPCLRSQGILETVVRPLSSLKRKEAKCST
jgi:hypothetical protein